MTKKSLVICPNCGNSEKFTEKLENVTVQYVYSWSKQGGFFDFDNEEVTDVKGERKLICTVCGNDCSDQQDIFDRTHPVFESPYTPIRSP